MKRLMVDLPEEYLKPKFGELLRRTFAYLTGVAVFLLCIVPAAIVIVWVAITVLVGPLR